MSIVILGASSRRTWFVALAVPLLAWALLVWRFDFVCDDAFIYFRYAKNLVLGHGLRFNAAEDPPIEGHTAPLWVLAMALAELVGCAPAVASRLIAVVCSAALLALVARTAQRAFGLGAFGTAATALFFATTPAIAVWSTSGMETMPVALLLFVTWERLLGTPARSHTGAAAMAAVALSWLRVEGVAFVGVVLAAGLVEFVLTRRRDLLRALLVVGASVAAAVAVQTAWRFNYYGDWLPNTARVKVTAASVPEAVAQRRERGLYYVITYVLTVPSSLLALLGGMLGAAAPRRRLVVHAVIMVATSVGYSIAVGGDFMAFGRFLVPAMPFLALLFAAALAALAGAARPRRRAAFAVAFATACVVLSLLPAWNVHLFPREWFDRLHFRWNEEVRERETEYERWLSMDRKAQRWQQEGRMLARVTKPGESIILGAIGARAYYSQLFVYDQFCLVNREWSSLHGQVQRRSPGHDVHVPPEHFFARRPTYLTVASARSGARVEQVLGRDWPRSALARRTVVERYPFPAEPGFTPGQELWLVRFVWGK